MKYLVAIFVTFITIGACSVDPTTESSTGYSSRQGTSTTHTRVNEEYRNHNRTSTRTDNNENHGNVTHENTSHNVRYTRLQ